MPEPSSDARPMSVSSFTTLGTTLAATCSTDPAGRLAAGTLGAAVICVPPATVVGLGHQGDAAADARRNHGDRQRADGEGACARTLLRRLRRARRLLLRGTLRRSAAVGVVGLLPVGMLLLRVLLLLGRVSPVVGLLLIAGMPVR